jgi:hypothetical protein
LRLNHRFYRQDVDVGSFLFVSFSVFRGQWIGCAPPKTARTRPSLLTRSLLVWLLLIPFSVK